MDKLTQLLRKCKHSVQVNVNDHRDVFQTVAEALEREDRTDIAPDVWEGMLRTDTVVVVHFYPDTTNGFYRVLHYDLEQALDLALSVFDT
jgi:hypothetical protein